MAKSEGNTHSHDFRRVRLHTPCFSCTCSTPDAHLLCLTVVVEGIEICRRPKARVKVSRGDSRRHPLVISEQRQQCLPASLRVVPISPVGVHELDGLPKDVFTLWIAIQIIHKAGHGVVKVVSLHAVFVVHNKLHELKALALVDSQHDVIVEELTWKESGQIVEKNTNSEC